MGRRTDVCAGPENRPYREAWDAWDTAYEAWLQHCLDTAENAAEALSAVYEDEEARTTAFDALGLPQPPATPAEACVLGAPVWCSRCRARIRGALGSIGDLAALLESWADGHRGAASGEQILSRRASTPSPSPITDTLDELYGRLAEVEAGWRAHAGHQTRPRRSRNAEARELVLAYLQAHLDEMLKHPGSVTFGYEVWVWERRLRTLAKSDPVVRKRPGRCPRCRLVNVLRTRDDGHTECCDCGRLMNEEEYQRDVVGGADTAVVAESKEARRAS
ncbi:hypothetical protein [Actinomadura rudentiformis]|uniref:Uncharacterized protein n=1 Tax=Actinomadura rudentiformis TaxID=359158 RepID=A0A6H9YZ78_9ACTN|nr:hypothetical protein [Actinomadura rudentiformis]KAB2347333.1 hypothetical protein F8566_20185 [Actinomadura rudentiformis]